MTATCKLGRAYNANTSTKDPSKTQQGEGEASASWCAADTDASHKSEQLPGAIQDSQDPVVDSSHAAQNETAAADDADEVEDTDDEVIDFPTDPSVLQLMSEGLKPAAAYSLHTAFLSAIIVLAALPVTSAATQLARMAFLHIKDVMGEGYGMDYHSPDHMDGLWPVMPFKVLQHVTSASANMLMRWAVMCYAWQGWEKARGIPLLVVIVTFIIYVAVFVAATAAHNNNVISVRADFVTVAIITPCNFAAIASMVKTSTSMESRKVMKLVLYSTLLEWNCTMASVCTVVFFFQIQSSVARIAVRTFVPMLVRRVWIHFSFHLSMRFEVAREQHRFMLMLFPVAVSSACGTCLQLGSSLEEAATMSACTLFLEVSDAITLLSGSTQLEQSLKALKWCHKKSQVLFTSIESARDLGNAGDEVAESSASMKQKQMIDQEQRKPLLAATAAHVCIAEGACLVLFMLQQVFLPISLGASGVPVPLATTLQVFALSISMEFLGDLLIAFGSFGLSNKWPSTFLDASTGRQQLNLRTRSGAMTLVVITFVCMDQISLYLSSLCIASNASNEFPMVLGYCKFSI
eukprot:TRINITY_DN65317_c0_g1_i1.p1 TRINITY_DN65317_c0_g1~~TRINITY_DN65317_c0_g1_i1.p1  ORF type:complete len:576 (-),score=107.20 TRINITY_DN65317_c0_g1_i1:8-1735(-)